MPDTQLRLVRLTRPDQLVSWARQFQNDVERMFSKFALEVRAMSSGGGGMVSVVWNESPAGAFPGTGPFTLAHTPVLLVLVLNSFTLDKVVTPVTAEEYAITANSITTFKSVTASDKFKAHYIY